MAVKVLCTHCEQKILLDESLVKPGLICPNCKGGISVSSKIHAPVQTTQRKMVAPAIYPVGEAKLLTPYSVPTTPPTKGSVSAS